jgi:hypothetical protein
LKRRYKQLARSTESGVGVTIMGISAVLVLMIILFATQTLVVLQRRSIVHSIASDIASQVATQRYAADDDGYTKSVVRLLGPCTPPVLACSPRCLAESLVLIKRSSVESNDCNETHPMKPIQ